MPKSMLERILSLERKIKELYCKVFNLQPNYKVYTALVTQSTSTLTESNISSGTLTKGVTYRIVGNGGNFLNVGAPDNNNNTYFVATKSIEPTYWNPGLVYLIYIEGAPQVKVLENTIGNIWFSYLESKKYGCVSDGLFTQDKTIIDMDPYGTNGNTGTLVVYKDLTINDFKIETRNDGDLTNTRLEIKVYN
jgi:hypothetical protein